MRSSWISLRLSLRWRVVAAATVVAGLGLLGAAALLVEVTERSLFRDARSDAEAAVEGVAESFANGVPRGELGLDAGPAMTVHVRDFAGNVIAWSAAAPSGTFVVEAPPTLVPADGRVSPEFVDAVSVVAFDGASYTVSAAVPAQTIRRTLQTLEKVLLFGIPLLIAAMAGFIWWLTGRALAPVKRLIERAGHIGPPAEGQRLPVPEADDEIALLASTLNEMLGRLDESALRARRFVSDASHELRSPIAAIRAVVESSQRAESRSGGDEVMADVLAETERLERLVGDLLTLARHDEAPRNGHGPVDLALVLQEEVARPRAVPVLLESTAPAVVLGNAERLGQLARHLLDNAARHARTSVKVQLGVGEHAILRVIDDGSGVREEYRELIFERFGRLDEARARRDGGFGLGLAVCAAVVEEHGGSIAVDDAPGGGAEFVIALPPHRPALADAAGSTSLLVQRGA